MSLSIVLLLHLEIESIFL